MRVQKRSDVRPPVSSLTYCLRSCALLSSCSSLRNLAISFCTLISSDFAFSIASRLSCKTAQPPKLTSNKTNIKTRNREINLKITARAAAAAVIMKPGLSSALVVLSPSSQRAPPLSSSSIHHDAFLSSPSSTQSHVRNVCNIRNIIYKNITGD